MGLVAGDSEEFEEGRGGAEVHRLGDLEGVYPAGGEGIGLGAGAAGTRKSTYANPEFQKVAKFAAAEAKAITTARPTQSTLPPSPYVGVQFAAIPEFQSIGADEPGLIGPVLLAM